MVSSFETLKLSIKVIQAFGDRYRGQKIDVVLTIEARRFIFGSALAYKLSLPLVLIRKCGRFPEETLSQQFELEYGTDCLEKAKGSLFLTISLPKGDRSSKSACQTGRSRSRRNRLSP
jgi:adenine phosphoribosyltransferase